jgi:hypothetical protein
MLLDFIVGREHRNIACRTCEMQDSDAPGTGWKRCAGVERIA